MNLLADEGVDRQIADRLCALGHEVFYAAESAQAASNDALLDLANQSGALLLTRTKTSASWLFECTAFMRHPPPLGRPLRRQ